MANTLKFGAGQWATKEGSTLAYNDENDNYKPLPFDFTRASSATVVNKAGLIETVGNAIPRIDFLGNTQGALKLEPQRTNLITYSESFPNPYWTKSGASIQGNPSTEGSELVTNGDFATDSYWNKLGNTTISGGKLNIINSNGTVIYQANVWEVGKTYKIVVQCTFVSGTRIILPYDGSHFGIKVTTPSSETYTYYYTPSSTNLHIYSDGNGNGSIDNVSIKEVQGFSAPDGTNNAYKLVEDTSNSSHRIYQGTSASSKTLSFYAKADDRTWVSVLSRLGGYSYFDIENGVLGTIESSSVGTIEAVGNNGWYRCTLYNGHGTNGAYIGLASSDNTADYQGDGTSGVYIYGAQIEDGSYSTSYIATSGSAVTRLRDLSDTQNLSHVIGQTEGVIFYDAILVHKSTSTAEDLFELSIDDGSNQNIFYINNYNNTLVVALANGGSNQFYNNSYNPTEGARYKLAFAYKQNDFALYINGNQIATDLSGTVPTMNQITFGNYYNNGTNVSNSVKVNDFRFYNTRLSNSELAALTTI